MTQANITDTYSDGTYIDYEASSLESSIYGKTGPIDWLMAFYLFAVGALEATRLYFVSTYLAYIVFVVFILSFNYGQVIRIPAFWLMILLMIWLYFTALLSPYRVFAMLGTWFVFKIHLAALIFMARCSSLSRFLLYAKAIIIGASIVAVSGAILGYSVAAAGGRQQKGLTSHTSAIGMMVFTGMITGIILYPVVSKKWKLIIGGYFIAAIISLLASGARGPAVVCATAVLIHFSMEHIRYLKRNIKVVIPTLILIVCIPWFVLKMFPYSPLVIRMTKLYYGGREATSGRVDIYASAWKIIKENPYFGTGTGTYKAYTIFSYTHTTFLEIMIAGGILAFLLYYGYYAYIFWKLHILTKTYEENAALRKMFNGCRSALLAITALGAFEVVIYQKAATFLIACMAGLAVRWLTLLKQQSQVFSEDSYDQHPAPELERKELPESIP